jgi:DNA-binding MarR family transcriptional regulator
VPASAPVRLRADFERVYPGSSRLATECAMNLVRTGDLVVGRVASLVGDFGISPAGGLVLNILIEASEPLSQTTLKERLLVTGPTVTGLVDSLERRGLVRRRLDAADRRRRLIEITPEGRSVAGTFLPLVHAAERPWLARLSTAEQRTLLDFLGRIQRQLTASA